MGSVGRRYRSSKFCNRAISAITSSAIPLKWRQGVQRALSRSCCRCCLLPAALQPLPLQHRRPHLTFHSVASCRRAFRARPSTSRTIPSPRASTGAQTTRPRTALAASVRRAIYVNRRLLHRRRRFRRRRRRPPYHQIGHCSRRRRLNILHHSRHPQRCHPRHARRA